MSVTLAQARSRLRTWLEDTGPNPLWSDDEIHEALRQALDVYSLYAPEERMATLTAAGGDTALALPAEAGPVVRVTDAGGYVVPPRAAPARDVSSEELAWERWGDEVVFSRPLAAGDYRVRYYGARVLPADAADPVPVPEADVSLVVAGAAVWAIEERMRQEWKRGPLPGRYESRREAARQDFQDLLAAFRRRPRSRTLQAPG